MVIVYQATIATDRDINAVSLEIFVASFRYVDQGGSLSATDTFLLTGDTDGTTTDTYLDEIRSGISQVVETILVNHVSGTNQYLVSVGILDPVQGLVLPFGIAVGRVDTQYVNASLYQCRNTFLIVAGVDTGTY